MPLSPAPTHSESIRSLIVALGATLAVVSPSWGRAQEPGAPCIVRGTLTLPNGAAAAGATVQLRGGVANRQLKRRYGVPADWRDPAELTTDATGKFELRFVPPRAFQFGLDAHLGGFSSVGWSWPSIEPGTTLDLGTIAFEPPCYIEGHIEGPEGELLVADWTVFGVALAARTDGRRTYGATATVDAASGTFRVGPFPPGQVQVYAGTTAGARIAAQTVEVRPDAPASVALLYLGPKLTTRIVCTTICRPFLPFDVADELGEAAKSSLVLLDADGAVLQHATRFVWSDRSWEFKDVPPATYAIELRDPRFEPRRIEKVIPGERYRIDLVGNASLALEVVSENGEPLDEYGLWIEYQGVDFSPNEFEMRGYGTPAPRDGVIMGVVPGNLSIEVRGPSGARARQIIGPVAAGERKAVRMTLAGR